MSLKEASKEYLQQYNVEDVINSGMNYLFILESPHKAEINNGYPVAGNSGVEMTKFIYWQKSEHAFGKLLSKIDNYIQHYKGLDQFGIMNVVSAPMQSSALEDELSTSEKKIVHILEKLRVNYGARSHRNQDWNQVKEVLISNFAKRLNNILSQQELEYIIPCGKFAQTYLQLVMTSQEFKSTAEIISGIPHPSRNQWRQYNSMSKLKAVLKESIYFKS
mgnify:CR=1 FL=1